MKLWELLAIPAGLCRQPSLVWQPHRYVFVMSHMRSRSTLLCHILGSHPELAGHLENHQSYLGAYDLLRLKAKLRLTDGKINPSGYVVDKLLHDRRVIAPSLMEKSHVTFLFLLRQPAQSIPSILRNERRRRSDFTLSRAATYYVDRLASLQRYASYAAQRIFIESDQLVERTDDVLRFIAQQLQLTTPLSEHYQRFRQTGRDGWGDASPAIHTGVVQRPLEDPAQPLLDLPPELLARATAAYQRCVQQCQLTCQHLDPLPARVSAA